MAFAPPFSSPNFQPLVPALVGSGLVPAALYKAKFYEAGTSIPKPIYTNASLSTAYPTPSNVATLDATGKALIYLGVGTYKLVLTDPSDNPIAGWTIDNINGNGGAFATGFVNSFSELEDVDTTAFPYTYIGGYYEPGDGGSGMFYNAESEASSDGGYIQNSNFDPTKKWFRVPDENGEVRAAAFGFCGVGDKTANLLAADSYAGSLALTLRICQGPQSGNRTMDGNITLNSPVMMDSFANLQYTSGVLTLNNPFTAGGWRVFLGSGTVVFGDPKQTTRPEWFGASTSETGANNATAFSKWTAAGGGLFIVPPGTWAHTGTFTPAAGKTTIFYGSVGTRKAGTFYGPASLINGTLDIDVAGDLTMTGSATFGGSLAASGNISGFNIESAGNIDATTGTGQITSKAVTGINLVSGGSVESTNGPVVSSAYVRAQAGTSSQTVKASGNLFRVIGAGNGSISANALTADGDRVTITVTGERNSGAASATISLAVGAATVFTANTPLNNVDFTTYRLVVDVIRTGATTFASSGSLTTNSVTSESGANKNFNATAYYNTGAITWASTNAVVSSQSGGSGQVQRILLGDLYPV